MAVSRGSAAFWVSWIRGHGRRQHITSYTLGQAFDLQWTSSIRSVSSASWALAPPNSLRYKQTKQSILSYPFHHASQPQTSTDQDEECESPDLFVLVRQAESSGPPTLLEIPLFDHTRPLNPLPFGTQRSLEFSFPLSTVEGSRVDDISIHSDNSPEREHGCFRSLFEAERCPAPFIHGSLFYCFHCPVTEQFAVATEKSGSDTGIEKQHLTFLCNQVFEESNTGHSEDEEKLAVMYERLQMELCNFFIKSHDYSMYTNDMEFINGLLNTKTKGRVAYQLTLTLWRLLCLIYFANVKVEVLKLTKHMEDRSIKARWRIRGLPVHTLMLRFYRRDKSQLYRSYDAFSTFYVRQDGLIHCHKVEKVMPTQPPVLPRVTSILASAIVALGMHDDRPALNLLPPLLSSIKQPRN
ncbi:uncharacterized protein C6orf136 homolog [Synchiropus picturatus]